MCSANGENELMKNTKSASRLRSMNIQSTSNSKSFEISVPELQKLSFRLIVDSMRIFDSYKEVGRNKATKILVATRIHAMIIAAIRADPDITQLVELHKALEHAQNNLSELAAQLDQIREADRLRNRDRTKTDQRLKELQAS
jgi:hypothetical protein